jgi:hypothetical protein|tara:strand:- start:303 stop:1085 length:783 start_codon:yes stop_codon:yes gene_type:complete
MDTRFWGPSGWKILHLVAYGYPDKPSLKDKQNYGLFFNSLKYILPCKYCRISLVKYYKQLPVEENLQSKETLILWIYNIHNKVNNKLRKQGLLKTSNPTKQEVDNIYKPLIEEPCQIPGWDFIYCMIFNFPKDKDNVSLDRLNGYITFFTYIGKVIPCNKYSTEFKKVIKLDPIENNFDSNKNLVNWLYRINCKIDTKIGNSQKSYKRICSVYNSHKTKACSKKNHKGKSTCRISNKKLSKRNKLMSRTNSINKFKHFIS